MAEIEQSPPEDQEAITSRELGYVLRSTVLWTIGNSITTGGFLTYFAAEMGIRGGLMGVFLAIPELAGGLAILARPLELGLGNRKTGWIICALTTRLFLTGIPIFSWFCAVATNESVAENESHRYGILMLVALASAAQSIGQVLWLSWMSEVFPRRNWGRFLALRNITTLVVLLIVPVGGGYLRDFVKTHPWEGMTQELTTQIFFRWVFILGNVLMLLSILPMLQVKAPGDSISVQAVRSRQLLWKILSEPGYRSVVWFQWWHAFWAGLTQSAFFDYRLHQLHVGLGTYYLLEGVMRLAQIPVSRLSGKLCDRKQTRRVLGCGVAVLSVSMVFWIVAAEWGWWWIWGAYLLWGAWGAINVGGPVLSLQMAPREDHSLHLAVAERGAGMWAGIAGMLGGLLLAELIAWGGSRGSSPAVAYQIMFGIGMVGRLCSLFWLMRIPVNHNR